MLALRVLKNKNSDPSCINVARRCCYFFRGGKNEVYKRTRKTFWYLRRWNMFLLEIFCEERRRKKEEDGARYSSRNRCLSTHVDMYICGTSLMMGALSKTSHLWRPSQIQQAASAACNMCLICCCVLLLPSLFPPQRPNWITFIHFG